MIKSFSEWINENEETSGQASREDLQVLFDLGLIDSMEFIRSVKRINPTGWVEDLLRELDARHQAEPNIWGKPSLNHRPYHTIEFTLSSDMVNMPEQHYNNYEYELVHEEPIEVVIYLDHDSSLQLIANYASSENGYDEDDDEDDDHSYYATWSYQGKRPLLTVGDILDIIDGFNDKVDEDTIEGSKDWRHD